MAEGQCKLSAVRVRAVKTTVSGSWSPLLSESQVSALQISLMNFTYMAQILWLSKGFRELIMLKQQPDTGKAKRRKEGTKRKEEVEEEKKSEGALLLEWITS